MTDENRIGATSYSGPSKRGPREICKMVCEKVRLRALLEIETARIAEALPFLNPAETSELQNLLAGELGREDAVTSQMVRAEADLASSVKAMTVTLPRVSSRLLQDELMRRIELGHCPPPASIIGEALEAAFGS